MKSYSFDVESKKMLMKLHIKVRSKWSDVFFQVHEIQDGLYKIFWRKALPERNFIDFILLVSEKYFSRKQLTFSEMYSTEEYKEELSKISPVNEISISDEEKNIILNLCNKGFPDNYDKISGRDGHSFELYLQGNKKLNLWCFTSESLKPVADVINFLVEKANLDKEMYGIKIRQ